MLKWDPPPSTVTLALILKQCTRQTVYEGKGCLPSTKPRLCSDKVWDLLQEWNGGKRCPDEPIKGIKNYNLGIL